MPVPAHASGKALTSESPLIVTAARRARRREILDLAYDLMLEHWIEIAALVLERERLEELRRRERLFARELDRDGIPL